MFLATLLAIALSFVRREMALKPRRLLAALETGGRAVLAVTATTATAGIIVGVVLLTGLGLKISSIIVDLAGGNLFFTVFYAAVAVWMLGLAVPVTASYIISAVMIAPALTDVGVPEVAAHMFIFYYAVLSEVSPPTALSPFAAAAITGGNPFTTMMLTWKYTLPAFLVPFAFTLSAEGLGVLLQAPLADIVRTVSTAAIGILALAMGLGGWLRQAATKVERTVAVAGGLLLFYATTITDVAGAVALSRRDRPPHRADRRLPRRHEAGGRRQEMLEGLRPAFLQPPHPVPLPFGERGLALVHRESEGDSCRVRGEGPASVNRESWMETASVGHGFHCLRRAEALRHRRSWHSSPVFV